MIYYRGILGNDYKLSFARDGVEGLEKTRLTRPDLIILDVLMPRKDGWAVLDELQSDNDLKTIPVIMLSMVDDDGKALPWERPPILQSLLTGRF